MRISCLIAFSLAALHFGGCRIAGKRETAAPTDVARGSFDDNNRMVLPIPTGLETPTTSSSQQPLTPSQRMTAFGLAAGTSKLQGRPREDSLSASITVDCYSFGPQFANDNWFAYVELRKAGEIVQTDNVSIEACGDIQIALFRLNREFSYDVEVLIYYEFELPNKPEVVFYKGKTDKPFTPGDRNVTLTLNKLVQDQRVNVAYERGPKEICLEEGYFWNGFECIDTPKTVVFNYTSRAQYGDAATSSLQKCLEISDQGRLKTCNFGEPNQTMTLRFYQKGIREGVDDPLLRDIEWYYILIGQEGASGNVCLTSGLTGEDHVLKKSACKVDKTGKVDESQLFSVYRTTQADKVGLDTFRIVSRYKSKDELCVSVPPEGTLKGTLPMQDDALVRLLSCNESPENVRQSQFVMFQALSDFGQKQEDKRRREWPTSK
ncbi:MAG: hypothetical protein HYW48_08275 [Deltaproteobacteria bacterium]|nr:hypothetical protein [Deltaproteobacteria bacterium]